MQYTDLIEALKPSEYRLFVKGWDKERYADIFKSDKYKHDKNGYRVYIPIGSQTIKDSEVEDDVRAVLRHYEYDLVDYKKGIAKNIKNGQNIKIGKVLKKVGAENILKSYTSDPAREASKHEYIVVISRHPYDIAGMSTGRGWTSCMNLHDGGFKEYVPLEIDAGSVVAYVTKKSDPDLKNPTGRIMIKPFVNVLDPDNKDFIYFGIERKIYGTPVPGFKQAVLEWVKWVNDSNKLDDVVYVTVNKTSYDDGMENLGKAIGNKELHRHLEDLRENPDQIHNMDSATDVEMMALLEGDMSLFKDIIERFGMPSERVQKFAVEQYARNILLIPDPSDAVKMAAIIENANIITKIENPTDEMITYAVTRKPELIARFPDASEKANLRAVNTNPEVYTFIKNPTDKVAITALRQLAALLNYIPNPTKEMQMAAVSNDPYAIRYLNKHGPIDVDVQMAAVKKDPYAIDSIRKPDKKVIDYVRSRGVYVED